MGILGSWFPIVMTGEWLHFGFAIFTYVFIINLFDQFMAGREYYWWIAAAWFSLFHLVEHFILFFQAQTGHFWFGRSVPTSLIQYFIPRIELHLFYNSVVTILVSVAMYYKLKTGVQNEELSKDCNCGVNVNESGSQPNIPNNAQSDCASTSSCYDYYHRQINRSEERKNPVGDVGSCDGVW